MLYTQRSRAALRINKTNHMYLVCKTFQGRNLSNFFNDVLENRWFWHYPMSNFHAQWNLLFYKPVETFTILWKYFFLVHSASQMLPSTWSRISAQLTKPHMQERVILHAKLKVSSMKDRKYIQKGGLITKDIFNNEHSKTIFQSPVFQLFNLINVKS